MNSPPGLPTKPAIPPAERSISNVTVQWERLGTCPCFLPEQVSTLGDWLLWRVIISTLGRGVNDDIDGKRMQRVGHVTVYSDIVQRNVDRDKTN